MKTHLLVVTALIGLGMASGEPNDPPERTFRAFCQHPAHGGKIWLEAASVLPGVALMEAYKHNKANPGHEAAILKLRGGRR